MQEGEEASQFIPNPSFYIERMQKDGTFLNHVFLQFLAWMIDHDFVIIYANTNTLVNDDYTLIKGNSFLRLKIKKGHPSHLGGENPIGSHGSHFPIFLGYFEDTIYEAGHYQSIVPYCGNKIFQKILTQSGFNETDYFSKFEGK